MKPEKPVPPKFRLLGMPPPLAVTLSYLLYGLIWIFFSDQIAAGMATSAEQLNLFSLIKGKLFIIVTALLLYLLLLRNEKKRNADRQALYDSQQRFSIAVHSGVFGVWDLDLTNNHLACDDRMHEIFKVNKEDFDGNNETWMKSIHPDDREMMDAKVKAAIDEKKAFETSFRILWPDGTVRYIHGYGQVYCDESGCPERMIGTSRDITEHVQSELPFRMLFEHAPNGVAICKPTEDLSDFIFSDVNPAGELCMGKSRDQVVGRAVTEIFPGIEESGLLDVFRDVAKTGEPEHYPMVQYKDNTLELWVENDVFKLSSGLIVALFKDVSELKKSEQKIEDLARFPEENTSPVMRVSTDGKLIYGNSASQVVQPVLLSHNSNYLTNMWMERVEKCLKQQRSIHWVLPAGKQMFSAVVVPVKDRGYLNIYAHDITRRIEAAQHLVETHSRFETLVSNLPGMAYRSWGTPYGSMEFVSAGCELLTGYAGDELVESLEVSFRDLIHPDDQQRVRNQILESTGKMEHYETEYRIIRRDGAERWMWERGVGCIDKKNRILLEGFITDITERKTATEKLRKLSEEKGLILNNNILGIALVENRVFKWVNPRLAQMCGRDIAELEGQSTQCIYVAEKDYLDMGKAYEFFARGERFECILQFVRAGGRLFWCRVIGVAVDPDKPQSGSIWMFEDITERKKSEEALRESQEYLEAIWNAMDVGIMLVDADTEKIMRVNPALAKISGKSPAKVIGQPCRSLVCTAKVGHCPVKDMGQKVDHCECSLEHADGHMVYVEKSVTTIKLDSRIVHVETIVDITERKQANANLARLSTAIEQSPEAIVITDVEGKIQYVNPAFEANTGYSYEEALGNNPKILKSGQHDDKFYKILWETIASGQVWEGRLVNKRKDGSLFTEDASIGPVKDAEGRITNYVGVKRDISLELVREEELRQGQKMEAIGMLAGSVAHDFNNILQGIMGFSTLLLGHLKPESLQHQQANEIHKASVRAAEITQQLLAFNRKQAIECSAQDVNEVINDMHALLEILMGENIKIKLNLGENLHKIYGDHGQLSQVVMNLAVNARDAMSVGGQLVISTGNGGFTDTQAAEISGACPGSHVCISIADTGTGMSEDILERLFDPFFTTKQLGSGTGLGLSVVYGIVKQSQGWMQVDSQLGEGTEFRIYFPAYEKESRSSGNLEKEDARPSRILLVEDDEIVLQTNKSILETAKYEVCAVGDAEQALELFNQDDEGFNLLISDLMLPGKNGIELADMLREKQPDLPVLLYSGYKEQITQWDSLHEKGYCFIEKPYKIMGFLVAVNETMRWGEV